MTSDGDAGCAVFASLVGSAVGDALGLPYENLSARRASKLLGEPARFRLFFGRGMVSDDAEHACMTCASVASSGGDLERFRRDLARRLRWWIATLPPGIGLATLKSTLRLWCGVSPSRSGVPAAGNGPAMRAAVLGRLVPAASLFEFVEASTVLTHRDDRAIVSAYAVAVASSLFMHDRAASFDEVLKWVGRCPERVDPTAVLRVIATIAPSLAQREPTADFAARICRRPGRVSGYMLETVPVALHAAFSARDGLEAARIAIRCGGDTDSVASIAGGIVGINNALLISRLIEWPSGEAWLRRLALAGRRRSQPPSFAVLSRLPRNALLLAAVLAHVGRRALPPY